MSEYLSPDLNKNTMHLLNKSENPDRHLRHLYNKVFHTKNLKLHTPKKDQCIVCGNYLKGIDEEKKLARV